MAVLPNSHSRPSLYSPQTRATGPGYQEKFYFNPGDTGFQVWDTRYARVGVGICWDQWFPETARCLALQGAEVLFFPTAIGTEPQDATIDSQPHWTHTMQVCACVRVCVSSCVAVMKRCAPLRRGCLVSCMCRALVT